MLHPTVSERIFFGGRTCRYLKTQDENHGIGQVREEMEGVGRNRDRTGLEPKDHFDHEKGKGGGDRHPACDEAVLD